MKIFDQTISGTFYVTFACLICGVMGSALTSPITKVERDDKVLLGYGFVIAYDTLQQSNSTCNSSSSFLEQPCEYCRQTLYLKNIQDGKRRRYMIAGLYFFGFAQLLCLTMLITSVVRIFLQESIRIRTSLRLMFLIVVIDVIFWFSMTAVLARKDIEYLVENGFYDDKGFSDVKHGKSSIRAGFYLSLVTLIFCLVSVCLVPWAAAH